MASEPEPERDHSLSPDQHQLIHNPASVSVNVQSGGRGGGSSERSSTSGGLKKGGGIKVKRGPGLLQRGSGKEADGDGGSEIRAPETAKLLELEQLPRGE